MNQTLKIFLASAIGALLGAIVALDIRPSLWWLGLFAGFAGGYLSYEFKTILAAIPVAWRRTKEWRPDGE